MFPWSVKIIYGIVFQAGSFNYFPDLKFCLLSNISLAPPRSRIAYCYHFKYTFFFLLFFFCMTGGKRRSSF